MKNIISRIVALAFLFLLPHYLWAQGIEIQPGASVEASGSPTVEISNGNFINNGTYTKSTETFYLTGTTIDSVSGTSNTDIYILNINNNNGVILRGSGELTVNKTLQLTSGLVTTGNNVLNIANNATVEGASSTRYINGTLWKTGNQAFTFPVGNNGKYAPVGMSAPVNSTDQFNASYVKESPNPLYNTSSLGPGVNHVSDCEYWNLNRINGNSNVNVILNWDTTSCGVTDLNELNVSRWDGSRWVNEGNAGTTGTTRAGSITSIPQSNFGVYTLASTTVNNPLPIGLLYFVVSKKDQQVLLNWSTSSEVNNDFFAVEKSSDISYWKIIGYIKGAGNSTHQNNYEYKDPNPTPGDQYYRLKQTDYDGNFTFSDTKSINFENAGDSKISMYPSPANSFVNVKVDDNESENTSIRVLTLDGRPVSEMKNLTGNSGGLDVSSLANGIYFIEVNHNDKITRLKMVKN